MAKRWIDERHYQIKHIGEDGEYWVDYKTNVTEKAIYITEELAIKEAAEYEGGRIATSLREWKDGVDEQGRKVFYEKLDGTLIPICAYFIEWKRTSVTFTYRQLDGTEIRVRYEVE